MRTELIGLKGGRKQQWLRLHRKEVEKCYFERGPEVTMAEYGMGNDTMIRFMERSNKETAITRLSQADRWVLEASRAGTAEVRGRVLDLEDWRTEVQPIIDVGKALINATMRNIEAKVTNTTLLDGISQAQQLSRKLKE